VHRVGHLPRIVVTVNGVVNSEEWRAFKKTRDFCYWSNPLRAANSTVFATETAGSSHFGFRK